MILIDGNISECPEFVGFLTVEPGDEQCADSHDSDGAENDAPARPGPPPGRPGPPPLGRPSSDTASAAPPPRPRPPSGRSSSTSSNDPLTGIAAAAAASAATLRSSSGPPKANGVMVPPPKPTAAKPRPPSAGKTPSPSFSTPPPSSVDASYHPLPSHSSAAGKSAGTAGTLTCKWKGSTKSVELSGEAANDAVHKPTFSSVKFAVADLLGTMAGRPLLARFVLNYRDRAGDLIVIADDEYLDLFASERSTSSVLALEAISPGDYSKYNSVDCSYSVGAGSAVVVVPPANRGSFGPQPSAFAAARDLLNTSEGSSGAIEAGSVSAARGRFNSSDGGGAKKPAASSLEGGGANKFGIKLKCSSFSGSSSTDPDSTAAISSSSSSSSGVFGVKLKSSGSSSSLPRGKIPSVSGAKPSIASCKPLLPGRKPAIAKSKPTIVVISKPPLPSGKPTISSGLSKAPDCVLPLPVVDWGASTVVAWAKENSLKFDFKMLVAENITGSVLLELEDDDLAELGVASGLQRKKIRAAIKALA